MFSLLCIYSRFWASAFFHTLSHFFLFVVSIMKFTHNINLNKRNSSSNNFHFFWLWHIEILFKLNWDIKKANQCVWNRRVKAHQVCEEICTREMTQKRSFGMINIWEVNWHTSEELFGLTTSRNKSLWINYSLEASIIGNLP